MTPRRIRWKPSWPSLHGTKAIVDEFVEHGEVVGIGPFTDGGNMAIFRSLDAAERFVARDPFIIEGLVASFVIRPWADELLP